MKYWIFKTFKTPECLMQFNPPLELLLSLMENNVNINWKCTHTVVSYFRSFKVCTALSNVLQSKWNLLLTRMHKLTLQLQNCFCKSHDFKRDFFLANRECRIFTAGWRFTWHIIEFKFRLAAPFSWEWRGKSKWEEIDKRFYLCDNVISGPFSRASPNSPTSSCQKAVYY